MRMIMNVEFPAEPFNTLVRKGTVGKTIQKILETVKPEAAYFTEQDGHRGGLFIVDVKDAGSIPGLAEPFFLTFNAVCKFRIAMTPRTWPSPASTNSPPAGNNRQIEENLHRKRLLSPGWIRYPLEDEPQPRARSLYRT
jgi:hypothetical protein